MCPALFGRPHRIEKRMSLTCGGVHVRVVGRNKRRGTVSILMLPATPRGSGMQRDTRHKWEPWNAGTARRSRSLEMVTSMAPLVPAYVLRATRLLHAAVYKTDRIWPSLKLAEVASTTCSWKLAFGAAVFFTDRISDHSEVWSDRWREGKFVADPHRAEPGHYAASEH